MERLDGGSVLDVAAVEQELAALWRSAGEDDAAVIRACKHNLVVVCEATDEALEQATATVAAVAESEPGRFLVVAPAEDGRLDVHVSAHCHRGRNGARVCCEQVTLRGDFADAHTLPGSVLQLLVGDVPADVYWRREALVDEPLLDRLLDLGDRLIVRSATFRRPLRALRAMERLAQRPHAVLSDVGWAGLDPWREAIASLFDAPSVQGHVQQLVRVELNGDGRDEPGVAVRWLAGWLASRLGWTTDGTTWRRPDGAAVEWVLRHSAELPRGTAGSVRLVAEQGGTTATFLAERLRADDDLIRLSVQAPGVPPQPRTLRLPRRDEAALLCGLLQAPSRDPLFEAALTAAVRIP